MKQKLILRLENVHKSYESEKILQGISLKMQKGESLMILGKSGVGKTTLLKLIAGFEIQDEGSILFENKPIIPPLGRLIKGHPQIALLSEQKQPFPKHSLAENLQYMLRNLSEIEQKKKIQKLLKVCGLQKMAHKRPHELSDGQKQRFRLALALAQEPKILLLDEPFAHLDTQTKAEIQQFVFQTLQKLKITSIWVTHDNQEIEQIPAQKFLLRNGKLKKWKANESKNLQIIVACDKFKGSLTALQACQAIAEGIANALPKSRVVQIPLADGGEGTLEILAQTLKAKLQNIQVSNPLFEPIQAQWAMAGKTAFMEMAQAAGLALLPKKLQNPMLTTTLGVGEMIQDALSKDVKKIVMGIGGSATNDAGMGMAKSLGVRFLDKKGKEIVPIGKNLIEVAEIDVSGNILEQKKIEFWVACDVRNPLYGENGAAFVYAKQKGANHEQIRLLDEGLQHFAEIVKQKLGKDFAQEAGSGAAGGLGFGLMTFCNAKLLSGIDLILEILKFEKYLPQSQLIITGEGKMDAQTLQGKTIAGVVKKASYYQIPVVVLCGTLELEWQEMQNLGIAYASAILNSPTTLQEASQNAYILLRQKTEQILGFYKVCKNL
jgi:glycerate kinase